MNFILMAKQIKPLRSWSVHLIVFITIDDYINTPEIFIE